MISGVVLAAGTGRRMGRPKASVGVGGRSLLQRAVSVLAAGGCHEVIAVVREERFPPPPMPMTARLIPNPQADSGMASSLRLGLDAASGQAAVIVLVDQFGDHRRRRRGGDRVPHGWRGGRGGTPGRASLPSCAGGPIVVRRRSHDAVGRRGRPQVP